MPADPMPHTLTLPAADLLTVLRHAERERARLMVWRELGAAGLICDEASELAVAITTAYRSIVEGGRWDAVVIGIETAATLRYYAQRDLSALDAMAAACFEPDDDLEWQREALRSALARIPFTLAPINGAPRPANANGLPEGAALHG